MKISKQEQNRFFELKLFEKNGFIKNLEAQPVFLLRSQSGKAICRFTPDFKYTLLKDLFELSAGSQVIEEYKGSKKMWAYKRADYSIFRRWLIADYPNLHFIENINGKIQKPKIKYPKDKR
jgi:hypothetical protein